ncbi:hypothetical protein [Actinomadura miaoliensis]|uniref:Uncharacterized protein n=1 Tax=Actinomadura miaoliensis TaxID=430685 RepID=A0ABP7V947_9ACTN
MAKGPGVRARGAASAATLVNAARRCGVPTGEENGAAVLRVANAGWLVHPVEGSGVCG